MFIMDARALLTSKRATTQLRAHPNSQGTHIHVEECTRTHIRACRPASVYTMAIEVYIRISEVSGNELN